MKREVGIVLLALGLSLGSYSCGARVPPIQPLPDVLASVEQDVTAFRVYALNIMEAAGQMVNEASKTYKSLESAVPAGARPGVDRAFLSVSSRMREVNDKLRSGGIETWSALKAIIDPVLKDVQSLIDTVRAAGPSVWQKIGAGLVAAGRLVETASAPK